MRDLNFPFRTSIVEFIKFSSFAFSAVFALKAESASFWAARRLVSISDFRKTLDLNNSVRIIVPPTGSIITIYYLV